MIRLEGLVVGSCGKRERFLRPEGHFAVLEASFVDFMLDVQMRTKPGSPADNRANK
jgi:hypothetical protein